MGRASDYSAELRRAEVFAALGEADFELLISSLVTLEMEADQLLFMAGDAGDSMVVVAAGQLRITLPGPTGGEQVALLGPGDSIGEMACIDPAERSATVTAVEPSVVAHLSRALLDSLRSHAPEIFAGFTTGVIRQVTRRIRDTNQRVDTLLGRAGAPQRSEVADPSTAGKAHHGPVDLSDIPMLRGLTSADLDLLSSVAPPRSYLAGATLCAEGWPGRSCFLIARGEVQVFRGSPAEAHPLAILGPGALVGQMSLVDRAPRSASVRAKGSVMAIELTRDVFERLIEDATPLGIRFQEHLATAGIRQLRLANIQLARASRSPTEAAADAGRGASPDLDYVQTALGEWELTLEALDGDDELDDVELVRLDSLSIGRR